MRIEIDAGSQQLTLFDDAGLVLRRYGVSTSKNGLGETNGSFCTPRGRHIVRAKIGAGLPEGAVLVGRRPTGEVWSPELASRFPERDWMLTRLLWLSGCEPGRNRLGDVDSMRRYIYIHGTPDTSVMGKPGSIGCVRMRNADLVELFDLTPVYTPVDIGPDARAFLIDTQLQRMRRLATGLLVLAALVYVAATALEPRFAWLFYVRAASEAAMIGAIADWFAVVALFHHPLNLRFIPHTAIIPRSKARIAAGLSVFIQQNFLSSGAIVARIGEFRPARALCGWLLRGGNADVAAGYAARAVAFGLAAVDDERVRRFLQQAVAAALRRADVATAAARLLDVLTEGKRHHALLDEVLAGLDELLSREETRRYIAAEIADNAPLLKAISDFLRLKLDEKAALKVVDVAIKKIAEVRRDRDHDLRERFDRFVAGWIQRLKEDDSTRSAVSRFRDELLANPALAGYVAGVWDEIRDWLRADLEHDASTVRLKLAQWLRAFAGQLESHSEVQQWIDAQILHAVPALVDEHREAIGRFVEDQINSWQEKKLVGELERHIGPDLQFIRINGTIVGALAGLLIAVLTQLAR